MLIVIEFPYAFDCTPYVWSMSCLHICHCSGVLRLTATATLTSKERRIMMLRLTRQSVWSVSVLLAALIWMKGTETQCSRKSHRARTCVDKVLGSGIHVLYGDQGWGSASNGNFDVQWKRTKNGDPPTMLSICDQQYSCSSSPPQFCFTVIHDLFVSDLCLSPYGTLYVAPQYYVSLRYPSHIDFSISLVLIVYCNTHCLLYAIVAGVLLLTATATLTFGERRMMILQLTRRSSWSVPRLVGNLGM